jgi:DNA topoisomerase II
MGVREEPEIKDNPDRKDYTCISFKPDLKRFGMENLDEDIIALMTKRVYDLAGCTPAGVKVKLNGKVIDIKQFISYVDLYLQTQENKELPKIIEKP